jgi:N-acetylneuraminic acid mutarotase
LKSRRIIILVLLVVLAALAVLVGAYQASTSVACRVPDYPLSADKGRWTEGAALPTPRSELAATALDGKIYVAGGLAGSAVSDAFEVYDPATDTWRVAAALPVPAHHPALAALGGQVYLSGGFGDLAFRQVSQATWAYDPQSDGWQPVADLPVGRAAHSMAAVGGKLYVVGGVPDATALWAYDPASDTWETGLAPMPTPREHLASAVVDSKLYVIGGRWDGAGNRATLEVYDPATDAWESLPDMPSRRGGLTAGAIDNQIYVGGGEDPWARQGSGCTYNTLEVYDTSAGGWARLEDLPTARHGLASAVVDGRWYVLGGATKPTAGTFVSVSDRVEIYSRERSPERSPGF